MTYVVAVRALCDFTARRGDLDLRFTPAPSAQQGIAGHTLVASKRGPDYQTEVSLIGDYGHLHVRGRADGYDAAAGQLEEIKTFRGDFDAIPDNHRQLHWAQLKIYGWLLCLRDGLAELRLALVYFNIDDQQETLLIQTLSATELQTFFEVQCSCFLAWSTQELAHRSARDEALLALAFPHADFRPGQRELAEAVYKSATQQRCLLVQAPTGIGKTVGTLFPLLKSWPGERLDKVFFLSAKTSGRAVALGALAQLQAGASYRLRVLEMVARDKACEYPGKACHGDACPLAKGFYDRLPVARSAAVAASLMDKSGLREVALAHQVCPYYLSQDLARWADVVVGDYNYYLDTNAFLFALTQAHDWRVSLLIDEAHNLVDRARQMYSATLDQRHLNALRRSAPAALKSTLQRLDRAWDTLHRDHEADYQVVDAVARPFATALQQTTADITAWMADHRSAAVDTALQRFYFDALRFGRLAEVFGKHSLFDVTLDASQGKTQSVLCLRNVVPAPFTGPRLAAAHSAALFSATLNPWDYYADLLGLPETTVRVDVPSPFAASQLAVKVVRNISTRFAHRHTSLQPMVDLMAAQYAARPGNYLAFFSSFDYLAQALSLFTQQHPGIAVHEQTRGMDEPSREEFLARFTHTSEGIGFAVLGGSFGEGIDLPGQQLIGAFIATLGLPQLNPINEQFRLRMAEIFGNGYDYTYLYPGLRKVVQAAGRVIRTPSDEGVIYLIDDRFSLPDVLKLLPAWWRVGFMRAGASMPDSNQTRVKPALLPS